MIRPFLILASLMTPSLAWGYDGLHCNFGTPDDTSVHLTRHADGGHLFELNHAGNSKMIAIHSGLIRAGDLPWLAKKSGFMEAMGSLVVIRFAPGECRLVEAGKVGICRKNAIGIGKVKEVDFAMYYAPSTVTAADGVIDERMGFSFDYTAPATSPYLDGETGNPHKKVRMSVTIEYPASGCTIRGLNVSK